MGIDKFKSGTRKDVSHRTTKYSDEELLNSVNLCYERYGKVTGKLLSKDDDFPDRTTIQKRFGSIDEAKELAQIDDTFNSDDYEYYPKGYKDKEWLSIMYLDNKLSLKQIEKLTDVTHETIRLYMEKYDIPRRGRKNVRNNLDDEHIISMYQDGFTVNDICNHIDEGYGTVYSVLVGNDINIRDSSDYLRQDIDVSDYENMAYFIGVMIGDGWRYISKENKARIIGLDVIDEEFMRSFKKCLESIGLNTHTRVRPSDTKQHDNAKTSYEVICVSINLYEWIEDIDMDLIKDIIYDDVKCSREFVRGFYESEGNFETKGNGVVCSISNTNDRIIDLVDATLLEIGYDFNRYKYGRSKNEKDITLLVLSREKDVYSFIDEINPVTKNAN